MRQHPDGEVGVAVGVSLWGLSEFHPWIATIDGRKGLSRFCDLAQSRARITFRLPLVKAPVAFPGHPTGIQPGCVFADNLSVLAAQGPCCFISRNGED